MTDIPCFTELAAARRRLGKRASIQCPVCGADTGVQPEVPGEPPSPKTLALRERLRRIGLSKKAALFWTTSK